jgi:cobyrinic acid a,c-diamide synthase
MPIWIESEAQAAPLRGIEGYCEGGFGKGQDRHSSHDEAFCFYYYENFRELERRGAELVFFSPLRDNLPNVDGLYIGGVSRLHAAALSCSCPKADKRRPQRMECPSTAECGGLIYLCRKLSSRNQRHNMAGALPALLS